MQVYWDMLRRNSCKRRMLVIQVWENWAFKTSTNLPLGSVPWSIDTFFGSPRTSFWLLSIVCKWRETDLLKSVVTLACRRNRFTSSFVIPVYNRMSSKSKWLRLSDPASSPIKLSIKIRYHAWGHSCNLDVSLIKSLEESRSNTVLYDVWNSMLNEFFALLLLGLENRVLDLFHELNMRWDTAQNPNHPVYMVSQFDLFQFFDLILVVSNIDTSWIYHRTHLRSSVTCICRIFYR